MSSDRDTRAEAAKALPTDLTTDEIAAILAFAEGITLDGTVTSTPLFSADAVTERRRELAAERAAKADETAAAIAAMRRGV